MRNQSNTSKNLSVKFLYLSQHTVLLNKEVLMYTILKSTMSQSIC